MRHHESSAVQHVMRHKIVDKIDDLFLELEIPKVLQMDLAKSRADNFRLIHPGREVRNDDRATLHSSRLSIITASAAWS